MHRNIIAALSLVAVLTACESEADPTGPGTSTLPELNEIATTAPINATSTDTLVRFSLSANKVVTSAEDWDIAFRRYEIRLNGGVSGAKGVLGYNLENNEAATSAQVLGFTVENTLAAFDGIREDDIPAASLFASDRLVANDVGYVSFAGAPSANAAAYWKVRTAAGGYALMRVTAIAYNQQGSLTSVTFETRAQAGTSLGAPQPFTVAIAGSVTAISFATGGAVTPNACNWDVQVNPQSFAMTLNTACSAGTYPGPASPAFAAATAANDAPEYGAFLAGMVGPIPNSITDPSAPFRYNLENTNRLHPAFNTYLILVGENVYKLQVINYYSAAGASAYPTIRFARIR